MNSITERNTFYSQCFKLNPYIRFQNWQDGAPLFHFLYPTIFYHVWAKNKHFLRYSIENNDLTELRIDLDEKTLGSNVDLMYAMDTKLKDLGIKVSWYFSGGKGLHGHALLSLSSLSHVLRFNIDSFNLNNYEKEHKDKNDTFEHPIRDSIRLRSNERAQIKREVLNLIGFESRNDHMLYSSIEQLTCEGSCKRGTDNHKVYISSENLNKSSEDLIKWYEENKTKIILNLNYFNEISGLNDLVLDSVTKRVNKFNKEIKSKVNKVATVKLGIESPDNLFTDVSDFNLNDFKSLVKEKVPENKNTYLFMSAFVDLYKEKHIDSGNKFAFAVGRVIYSDCKNFEVLDYSLRLLNQIGAASLDNPTQKSKAIIEYSENNPHAKVLFTYVNNGQQIYSMQDFFFIVNRKRNLEGCY